LRQNAAKAKTKKKIQLYFGKLKFVCLDVVKHIMLDDVANASCYKRKKKPKNLPWSFKIGESETSAAK
jgi:hypothetical protein